MLTFVELLKLLSAIELKNVRVRTKIDVPKTLDLDLISHGVHIINSENLILPHPRFHERFFVQTTIVCLFLIKSLLAF